MHAVNPSLKSSNLLTSDEPISDDLPDLTSYARSTDSESHRLEPVSDDSDVESPDDQYLLPADRKTNKRLRKKKQNKRPIHDKIVTTLKILSDLSQIGIVIRDIIGTWIPAVLTMAGGALVAICPYTDPLIYSFKALERTLKLIGKHVFKLQFEDDIDGVHPHRDRADVFSLVLFVTAIMLLVLAPPLGVTIGWFLAFSACALILKYEYGHQMRVSYHSYQTAIEEEAEKKANLELAEQNFQEHQTPHSQQALTIAKQQHEIAVNKLDLAKYDYINKRNSYRFYQLVILSFAVLLLCSSAAVFAPPVLLPILAVLVKVATVTSIGLFFCRGVNAAWAYFFGPKSDDARKKAAAIKVLQDAEEDPAHSPQQRAVKKPSHSLEREKTTSPPAKIAKSKHSAQNAIQPETSPTRIHALLQKSSMGCQPVTKTEDETISAIDASKFQQQHLLRSKAPFHKRRRAPTSAAQNKNLSAEVPSLGSKY